MKPKKDKEFIDTLIENAKRIMETDGNHVPMAMLLSEDDAKIMQLDMDGEVAKKRSIFALRKAVEEFKIKRYFLINEAWYLSGRNIDITIKPPESSERKEAIIIAEYTKDKARIIIMPFIRS